jgi:hypothetical protein
MTVVIIIQPRIIRRRTTIITVTRLRITTGRLIPALAITLPMGIDLLRALGQRIGDVRQPPDAPMRFLFCLLDRRPIASK